MDEKKLEVVKEEKVYFLTAQELAEINVNFDKREKKIHTINNKKLFLDNLKLRQKISELEIKILAQDMVTVTNDIKASQEILKGIEADRKAMLEKVQKKLNLQSPILGFNPETGEIDLTGG